MIKGSAGYHYFAEGHHYILDPEVMVGLNRLHLVGAGIFNMDMEYLGYWDRFNMPTDVQRGLLAWFKRERQHVILDKRTKLLKQSKDANKRR